MRVRGFCQNDAHIYCHYDQAKEEFLKVMRLHGCYYDLMGIEEYHMTSLAA
jgi:threonyl-tRNA synthetase